MEHGEQHGMQHDEPYHDQRNQPHDIHRGDLQIEMQAIRQRAQQHSEARAQAHASTSMASELVREEVSAILNAVGQDYAAADPDRLTFTAKQSGTGFSLEYAPADLNAPGAWNVPVFDVTATVSVTPSLAQSSQHGTAATAPAMASNPAPPTGDVTIKVKDGSWVHRDNVLGNWANWTDETQVYQGSVNEDRIRSALDQAFLTWYRRVTAAQ